MPRRHPKEDDTKTGPSPQKLAERRERREERRDRRSPGMGAPRGLLIDAERTELKLARRDAIRQGDELGQARIERELELDRESLSKKKRSRD